MSMALGSFILGVVAIGVGILEGSRQGFWVIAIAGSFCSIAGVLMMWRRHGKSQATASESEQSPSRFIDSDDNDGQIVVINAASNAKQFLHGKTHDVFLKNIVHIPFTGKDGECGLRH